MATNNNMTRRNHYLPQRYQRGFANGSRRVWVYDRKEDIYQERNPLKVGVEKDFYTTVDEKGNENDSVEKLFSQIEGATWPVIDLVDQRTQLFSSDDRIHLALFVACLKTRVPVFEESQQNLTQTLIREVAKLRSQTPDLIAETINKNSDNLIDKAQAEELFQIIHNDEYAIEVPRQNNIKMMLKIAAELGEELTVMDWTVYTTSVDNTFITCDNPFVTFPPPDHDLSLSGFGVLTPGAVSVAPLSKQTLLCFKRDGSGLFRFERAPRDFVRAVNCSIAANSDRFIIARDELLLRKVVQRTKADQWRNEYNFTVT